MRVLLQSRSNLFRDPGGDTAQVLRTRDALRALGVRAFTHAGPRADLRGVDVVHSFNLTRAGETVQQARLAHVAGVPLVLTAVWHSLSEYNREGREGIGKLAFRLLGQDDRLERVRAAYHEASIGGAWWCAGRVRRVGRRTPASTAIEKRRALRLAQAVVFNSAAERDALERGLGPLAPGKARVIPLGVDDDLAAGDPGAYHAKFGAKPFVLCAGRVEDLKNQRRVLAALAGTGLSVVFAGALNPRHRGYCRRFLREVERCPRARWLGPLNRLMMRSALAACRVHVLASWTESAGQVSLEAGASGARVVSTDRSPVRECLGDMAWYCDPSSVASIRAAVLEAWNAPKTPPLRGRLLPGRSWSNVVRNIADVYREVRRV